ncbi:hypothetical protein SAMN04515695_4932 [Pseudovibrio sp. Tun.PSC04-5.I4]|nr:hypothetical protein SAMN04515695_4932 [Pseudovibrio sp. Tun.PSC04-5.I4]
MEGQKLSVFIVKLGEPVDKTSYSPGTLYKFAIREL